MTTTRPRGRAGILCTIVAVGLAAVSAAAVQGALSPKLA